MSNGSLEAGDWRLEEEGRKKKKIRRGRWRPLARSAELVGVSCYRLNVYRYIVKIEI